MAELTPKERVMRLLRKEPIDTMPFFSGMGMVVMPGIEKAGLKFPTVHTDANRMAQSAIWSAKMMTMNRPGTMARTTCCPPKSRSEMSARCCPRRSRS